MTRPFVKKIFVVSRRCPGCKKTTRMVWNGWIINLPFGLSIVKDSCTCPDCKKRYVFPAHFIRRSRYTKKEKAV